MQTRDADRWCATRHTVQRDAEYIMKKQRVDGAVRRYSISIFMQATVTFRRVHAAHSHARARG